VIHRTTAQKLKKKGFLGFVHFLGADVYGKTIDVCRSSYYERERERERNRKRVGSHTV